MKLTTDISLKDVEWTPIGNADTAFCGVFDGNSKTISNLAVPSAPAAGLFGCMYGKVQDLTPRQPLGWRDRRLFHRQQYDDQQLPCIRFFCNNYT